MASTRVIRKWANEEQQWCFERGAAPTYIAGGINSGKTTACVLKLLTLMHKYKNSRAAIIRRSQTQLLKTTMESWYQWCAPRFYKPYGHRTEAAVTLNNGSKAYFIHLDKPESLDVLDGLELNFAYLSQCEEIDEKAFDVVDVRVGRWTGAEIPAEEIAAFGGPENWPWRSEEGAMVPPRYLFAEGYVTDEGHYLYRRFADESPEREKWAKQGYESRIVNTESNIYAIKANVDAALSKDQEYIDRFVRPRWGNPEGKIFRIDPMSLLKPDPQLLERIMRTMRLHRSLDHGDFNPTCVLWHATDHDGNIFTYREHYKGDTLVSDHRRMVFELSQEDFGKNSGGIPKYYSNMADPTIDSLSRGRTISSKPTWSIADEWRDCRMMDRETAVFWQMSVNDEDSTRSRMKEYLKVDPNHRHPVTGQRGAPHLYFIVAAPEYPHGCKEVLIDIRAQQRLKGKSGDREVWLDKRDDSIRDHGYDSQKYFVISRPALGIKAVVEDLKPGEIRISDYEKAAESTRRRKRLEERKQGVGRLGYG